MSSTIETDLFDENIRLGIENVAPRGAFIKRIQNIINETKKIENILWPEINQRSNSCFDDLANYQNKFVQIFLVFFSIFFHLYHE
jgi:hypothetical protein